MMQMKQLRELVRLSKNSIRAITASNSRIREYILLILGVFYFSVKVVSI